MSGVGRSAAWGRVRELRSLPRQVDGTSICYAPHYRHLKCSPLSEHRLVSDQFVVTSTKQYLFQDLYDLVTSSRYNAEIPLSDNRSKWANKLLYPSIHPAIHLYIYLSIYLPIIPIYLFIYLSIVPFPDQDHVTNQ